MAADDTGKSAFHASGDDDGIGLFKTRFRGEQALRTSDADIEDKFDRYVHPAKCFGRFLGDGSVGGASSEHGDETGGRNGRSGCGETGGAADFVDDGLGKSRAKVVELVEIETGGEAGLTGLLLPREDRGDCFGRFSGAIDHFGEAAAVGAFEIERDIGSRGFRGLGY